MGGGGKSQTSTQQVSIPPEVLARYNAVNARAEDVASRPFQQYGTTAEAFVAPLTQAQQQGIQQTQQYAQTAQPYFGAATDQLLSAQQQGQAGLAGAYPLMQQGLQAGQQLGGEAYGGYQSMLPSFLPAYGQAQQGIQQGLGAGQALLGGGLGYTLAGAQGVTPQQFSQQGIGQYMSPFMSNVVQQTMAAQAQQNAQQRRALTGEAIRAGAFGGDRAGIAQANLAYQQNLANQQTLANLLQGGYGQALGAFQQQQGVNLAADQANRAALQQTGQSLAGLGQQAFGMGTGAAQQQAALGQALAGLYGQQAQGLQGLGQQQFGQGLSAAQQQAQLAQQGYGMGAGTAQALAGLGQGAQAAGLQGAQALLGAGQIQQQTEQAGKQALYNQFLQQQGYPFQVAQFLANIAMGTGALSGSTTTTTQPSAFFSDRKMKEDIRKIGETKDGLPIYKFRYKGEDKEQTHIGYMADDVEKKHPDAVGEYGGAKTVDYNKVNARESMGGAVRDGGLGRAAYNPGGHIDANDMQALVAQNRKVMGLPDVGIHGQSPYELPRGGKAPIPQGTLHTPRLITPAAPPRQREGGLRGAMGTAQEAKQTGEMIFGRYNPQTKKYEGSLKEQAMAAFDSLKGITGGDKAAPAAAKPDMSDLDKESLKTGLYADGGLVPRHGYSKGSSVTGSIYESENSVVPKEVLENDQDKPELMTAKGGSGGGGGGGKSGLGTALNIGGKLVSLIPGVGTALGTGMQLASAFMADGGVVPRSAYQQGGADPDDVEGTMGYLIGKESGGDPRARAATSSAGGLLQITDATGRTILQRNPNIVAQMQQENVQYDPRARGFVATLPEHIQRAMGAAHIRQQQEVLRQQGYEPTRENIRMNWFLGESGGPAFLNALKENPDAPATSVVDPAAIKANQSIFFKKDGTPRSVSEVYALQTQGGGGEGGVGGGRQVASAQTTAPAGGEKGGLGDFLTSSRFLAPLGTGLLTMASSQSLYPGAAILQGLGAGLAATQPAEEREARIKEIKTDIAGKEQKQVQSSLTYMPDGTKIVWIKGGKFMYADEYDDLRSKGQEPELLGYVPPNAQQLAQSPDARYTPQGGAGGTGVSPTAPMKSPPGGVQLSPEALQAARDERAIIMRGGPQAATNKGISDLWLTKATQQGTDARSSIKGVGDIAQNIADNAQNEGFATMGFGANLRAQYMNFANTVLRSVGQPPINKLDEASQIQYKLSIVQAEMAAAGADQRSFAAMDQILGAQPNLEMSPEAATKLSADLWVARQRQIDRDNFRIAYGKPSYNSFAQADAYFNEEYSMERYQREQAAIQQLLKTDPQLLKDMRAGKLTAAQIDKGFEKTFGQPYTGISRYFVSGRR